MRLFTFISTLALAISTAFATPESLVIEGGSGAGEGYNIVLIAGNASAGAEKSLPELAKHLSKTLGVQSTVLFSAEDGKSITTPEAIDEADLVLFHIQKQQWPDETMTLIKDAIDRGSPMIGLGTSLQAFAFPKENKGPFASYSFDSSSWEGGFGQQILGSPWQGLSEGKGTTAKPSPAETENAILAGFSPLKASGPLPNAKPEEECTILLESPNQQPIAWTRELLVPAGTSQRIFTTTLGGGADLKQPPVTALLTNAALWCLELDE